MIPEWPCLGEEVLEGGWGSFVPGATSLMFDESGSLGLGAGVTLQMNRSSTRPPG